MLREERPEHHLNIHLLDPHTYSMVFGWYPVSYTHLDADAKIYSTYYTTRKDNAWAKACLLYTSRCV